MDKLLAFRKQLNEEAQQKLSVSDFIVKAVAKASLEVPQANQQWAKDSLRQFEHVDVSFAVATNNGLITPIVKSADTKTLGQIGLETKSLIDKAKNNKLLPTEYQGGTITISNLGMMGIDHFSAVINPPQACILAIGSTKKQPVFDETTGIKWENQMIITLSADHRVVDGAVGAQWINAFKKYMENPLLLCI